MGETWGDEEFFPISTGGGLQTVMVPKGTTVWCGWNGKVD